MIDSEVLSSIAQEVLSLYEKRNPNSAPLRTARGGAWHSRDDLKAAWVPLIEELVGARAVLSWAMVYPPGGHTIVHTHPGCDVAGSLTVSGRGFVGIHDFSGEIARVEVSPGSLLTFASDVRHGVIPAEDLRVVVVANFKYLAE
jgi:quercetin dioxygenase-like cupin family protein